MSKVKFAFSFMLSLLVLVFGSAAIFAQGDKPTEDITTKPRVVKAELKDVYKKWLTTDVPYIITGAEKKSVSGASDRRRA